MKIAGNITNIPGIYRITCLSNNKFYVGSTSQLRIRCLQHTRGLNNNSHGNLYLQRLWNKYGSHNFVFEIIELCSPEELLSKEQEHIEILNPDINMCKVAGSRLGVKCREETILKLRARKHTDETKKILSEKRMGMPSARKGVKALDSTIEKMRTANIGKRYSYEINMKKGRKGDKHSSWGKGRHVIQFDIAKNIMNEFISADQAALHIKKQYGGSNIRKCCEKKIPTAYGFNWAYKNDTI